MSHGESNLHRLDGPDPVHQAVTMARAFGVDHSLPPESAARVAILVEELVINLFDHAGLGAGDIVEMGLAREDATVRLSLIDPGEPFDPREAATEAAIPDRGGGAGLALVQAWSEIVDYRTRDGVNRLDLRIPDAPNIEEQA
ncbi:ATP-binding protein [Sphingomonas montanisoli]|uniref:ATP-binding protein n=1 Tax=Sphingomonas montanisoli TaxID=2606412 RepID=A0A5D9C3G4_9SPHN|nr:ATP-binding protein [Sphingomonas montanisoli]TZG25827.1 ATP-binding protein [Sphingomonas montanisoli]